MSNEQKPLKEKLAEYLDGAGPGAPRFLNDDAVLAEIGRTLLGVEDEPPSRVIVREIVPVGFVKHPEAAKYEQARQARDFEEVRERMRTTLPDYEVEAADTDYESFNFAFAATREAMRQEREERQAAVAEVREKVEAVRARDRQGMASRDPQIREAAELRYFSKHVKADL